MGVVKKNLNLHWDEVEVDLGLLCDGDLDRDIQIKVYDHESSGDHVHIGMIQMTVNKHVKVHWLRKIYIL